MEPDKAEAADKSMTEKLKELREWGTFFLTLLTLVAVPVLALVLRNQRLEMQQEADKKYVTQEAFRLEQVDRQTADKAIEDKTWQKIGETNGKLDSVIVQQATMMQTLVDLRELIKGRPPQN